MVPTVVSLEDARINKNKLLPTAYQYISYDITFVEQFLFCWTKNFPFLKWQYRAGAGTGAGAKIMEKVEPELEPKINNFGSATLLFSYILF